MLFEEKMERFAKMHGLQVDTSGYKRCDGCITIINNGGMTAVPYKETYTAPSDPDFFLLTSHWDLALLFHKHKRKPVWIFDYITELRDICPPMEAGMKWAYIMTECEHAWDACIYSEYLSLNGREVSVLGGTCDDLVRTFFPDDWQREIDALWD